MTRRRSGEWSNRKTVRNLQCLEEILERKKKMAHPIVDPLGIPVGGNNQPQQGMGINPVLQLLWPVFVQSIHDLLAAEPQNRPAVALTPQEIVDTAWEVANRALERMGFMFVFPMGVRVITPAELHEAQNRAFDQSGTEAAAPEATGKENQDDA